MLQTLPQELAKPYQDLVKSYENYLKATEAYKVSKMPRYISILQYCEEIQVSMDYEEMKEFALIARDVSVARGKPVRVGESPVGHLFCFHSEVLAEAFSEMVDED